MFFVIYENYIVALSRNSLQGILGLFRTEEISRKKLPDVVSPLSSVTFNVSVFN